MLIEHYEGLGFEAWRQLCKRYAPSGGQYELDMMNRLMHPHKARSISELPAAILRFECDLRHYRAKTGREFPAEWKSPTFLKILPDLHKEELVRRFQLGARDYETLVASIRGFSREAWFQAKGLSDMDIDYAGEDHSIWENRVDKPPAPDWLASTSWDDLSAAWSELHPETGDESVDWMGKGGKGGKTGGKTGGWKPKGGGKGEGKEQGGKTWTSKRLCHWCEGDDHLIADCPAKRAGKPKIKNGRPVRSLGTPHIR